MTGVLDLDAGKPLIETAPPIARTCSRVPVFRRVQQEDPNGCVPAAVATIMGKTYREVARELGARCGKFVYPDGEPSRYAVGIDFATDGIGIDDGIAYMREHGYFTAVMWRYLFNCPRRIWPVAPFAPVHICQVETSMSHALVMLGDGRVLDPNSGARTSLTDFAKVNQVVGILHPEWI